MAVCLKDSHSYFDLSGNANPLQHVRGKKNYVKVRLLSSTFPVNTLTGNVTQM